MELLETGTTLSSVSGGEMCFQLRALTLCFIGWRLTCALTIFLQVQQSHPRAAAGKSGLHRLDCLFLESV